MTAVARIVGRFVSWLAELDHPEPLLAAVRMPVRQGATLEREDRDGVVHYIER